MLLLLRNLFWTIIIPGAVTAYVPFLIVGQIPFPETWELLQWFALPVAATGAVILFYCIVTFGVTGRGTLSPLDAPRHLVVRGLYRYVRNPMYCGVLLILLAEAAFFKSLALLQYTGGWLILIHLVVVLYEEPALRRQFGDSYNEYARLVHRWLPCKPYTSGS
jgi:protein-S-isoprenylcysteine O-methyltransferase Ste14